MKPNSPRWSCQLVRTWSALTDRPPLGGGFGSSHIANCADCQRHFSAADSLDAALRHEASAQRRQPSAWLEQRIMQEIGQSTPPPRREGSWTGFAAFAGVAAAVALVSVVYFRATPSDSKPKIATMHTHMPTSPLTALAELSTPVASALKRDPLQAEADSVYADARSAVRFLAVNFLPDNSVAQNEHQRARQPSADG